MSGSSSRCCGDEPLEGQPVEDRVDRGDAEGVADRRAGRRSPALAEDPLRAGEVRRCRGRSRSSRRSPSRRSPAARARPSRAPPPRGGRRRTARRSRARSSSRSQLSRRCAPRGCRPWAAAGSPCCRSKASSSASDDAARHRAGVAARTGAPSPRPTAQAGRARQRAASRPSRPGCGGPGPRPSRGQPVLARAWRGGRCWWRRPAARGRRRARRAGRCVRCRRGYPWSISSTTTCSCPNSAVSRSSSSAAADSAARRQRLPDGALAAAGQHQPVPAPALGQLVEVVDRAALLVTAQLGVGHRARPAGGSPRRRGPAPAGGCPRGRRRRSAAWSGRGTARRRRWSRSPPCSCGGLGEQRGAVEPVVVGDRQCVQAEPDRLQHQLVGAAGAVEEAEVGVAVQLGVRRDRAVGSLDRRRGSAACACGVEIGASGSCGAAQAGEPRLELASTSIAGLFQPISRPCISRRPPR